MSDTLWHSPALQFDFDAFGWLWGNSDVPGGSCGERLTKEEAVEFAGALLDWANSEQANRIP